MAAQAVERRAVLPGSAEPEPVAPPEAAEAGAAAPEPVARPPVAEAGVAEPLAPLE